MKRTSFLLFMCMTYPTFADVYTSDILGACSSNFEHKLKAQLIPNQYTCSAGYFLPANTEVCATCPSGFSCSGGTYTFNEINNSGLVRNGNITQNINKACATNFAHKLRANFIPNQYACNAGHYLSSNAITCSVCTADNYCPGGTYTFNETVVQGIVQCPNSWYSPAGMSSVDQCGRILHIGDNVVYLRATKKTSPALHIDIDNDGVADFFGNMTTSDVVMNANTDKKLKLQYGGQTYSVYDDTVVVP